MSLLTRRDLAILLGATETKLSNWARAEILKNGTASHLFLPCVRPDQFNPRDIYYESDAVLEWLNRPLNHLYREHVLASFVSNEVRDRLLSNILDDLPDLPDTPPDPTPEPSAAALTALSIDQSAWRNYPSTPQETTP